jgi:hypothetical protein
MAKKNTSQYEDHKGEVLELLEEIQKIGGTSREYKAALLDLKEAVEEWIEASLDAVEDDIRRSREE